MPLDMTPRPGMDQIARLPVVTIKQIKKKLYLEEKKTILKIYYQKKTMFSLNERKKIQH